MQWSSCSTAEHLPREDRRTRGSFKADLGGASSKGLKVMSEEADEPGRLSAEVPWAAGCVGASSSEGCTSEEEFS